MTAFPASRLLDDLPAIFRDDPFLGQFLLAFEKLLVGIDDGVALPDPGVPAPGLGIERIVAGLALYFDPAQTPADFLPWLAGWVALTLRADLDESRQRKFLAGIARRYRRRGTAQNLVDLIGIFTDGTPEVTEDAAPHHFTLRVQLPPQSAFPGKAADYPAFIDRQTTIAHALVEMEKPAHTAYQLDPVFPSLQIEVHSTVGVDTLLGAALY
jgi:P2-related tail formation protein